MYIRIFSYVRRLKFISIIACCFQRENRDLSFSLSWTTHYYFIAPFHQRTSGEGEWEGDICRRVATAWFALVTTACSPFCSARCTLAERQPTYSSVLRFKPLPRGMFAIDSLSHYERGKTFFFCFCFTCWPVILLLTVRTAGFLLYSSSAQGCWLPMRNLTLNMPNYRKKYWYKIYSHLTNITSSNRV